MSNATKNKGAAWLFIQCTSPRTLLNATVEYQNITDRISVMNDPAPRK